MSVTSGFFNAINHDRRYGAESFARIFNGIINDGIFMNIGTALVPTANNTNQVFVGIGRAWFNSTWTENDSIYAITVPASDLVRPRIDALVLEVNTTDSVRENSFKIVQGTPSAEPQKPTLTSENGVYQHALAYITRRANDEVVKSADLEITVGTDECPFVTGILETISIDILFDKWRDDLDQFVEDETNELNAWFEATEADVEEWINTQETDLETWIANNQATFLAWFNEMKGILDEDYAASIQLQLNDINVKRYLYDGFESCTKTFSADGKTIVSVSTDTATEGMKITKTFSDDFNTITTVLTSAQDADVAKLVKVISADGSTMTSTMTIY